MHSHIPLLKSCILKCQQWLTSQGFTAKVHFELEGMVAMPYGRELDFQQLNRELCGLRIPGEIKKEYWPGQWEYVSDMAGQSPLQEADYLSEVMNRLPRLMKQQGAQHVFLDPVVWHGSGQRYAQGSDAIFAEQTGTVHVPNAIQVNVSITDHQGINMMPDSGLGEWLQYQLLQTSYACCLLYLPEADAFERLALRTEYGLDIELSSPWELSGGYKGSIALYKEKGKHDQPMGLTTLIYGPDNKPMVSEENWRSTCRVEHRLGATSQDYDPYVNVLFVMLNVISAIENWRNNPQAPEFCARPLPQSLLPKSSSESPSKPDALSLFMADTWFQETIDMYCQNLMVNNTCYQAPGELIKQTILRKYLPNIVCTQNENFELLQGNP